MGHGIYLKNGLQLDLVGRVLHQEPLEPDDQQARHDEEHVGRGEEHGQHGEDFALPVHVAAEDCSIKIVYKKPK